MVASVLVIANTQLSGPGLVKSSGRILDSGYLRFYVPVSSLLVRRGNEYWPPVKAEGLKNRLSSYSKVE